MAKRPNSSDIHLSLGMALMQTRQWNEAIDQLEWALRLEPDNTQARAGLDQVRRYRGF